MTAVTAPQLRIGNAERESATRALDAHLEAGRLDAEEYGERFAKATVARTHDELAALFTDLPEPHAAKPVAVPQPPPPAPRRRFSLAPVLALLPAVAILAFVFGFWQVGVALFVVGGVVSGGCGPRRHHHRGPYRG